MRPTEVTTALQTFIDVKQPTMLHGSPGVGKSDLVRQLAKTNDMELIDLRLSQLDPVDLRGIPNVSKAHKTQWNTPNFLPESGKGILFLDEIVSASQATQAAAYQLVLDRKLGDYTLPDGWVVFAAGNRRTDGALVNQMSTALRNRFAHINFEVNNDDWCAWALAANIAIEVLGFIRFRPSMLNEFERRDNSEEENERLRNLKNQNAFATPRSWEMVSRVVKSGISNDTAFELFSGIVGEGNAGEFFAYMKYYRSLPDLDLVFTSPNAVTIPVEMATLYALATGLGHKATPDNFEKLTIFLKRIPIEFQTLCIKDAIGRDFSLTESPAFTEWAKDNSEFLF